MLCGLSALVECVNSDVCNVGQDRDHDLHLMTAKVVVIRIGESVVVRDLSLTTRTLKTHVDRQGSVAGRGLMGDSASGGLAREFTWGGRDCCTVQSSNIQFHLITGQSPVTCHPDTCWKVQKWTKDTFVS